jgi:hypothetical protein
MRKIVLAAACALAVIVGAAATTAALQTTAQPGQTTAQPGQMTQARVWVQNRGREEAVAVDLRDVNLTRPLAVHVVSGESGSGGVTDALQTRAARQLWDYDTAVIRPGTDIAPALNERGNAGWEAVGMVNGAAGGVTILLKRPR